MNTVTKVKGKDHLIKCLNGTKVQERYNSNISLTLALNESGWTPCHGHAPHGKNCYPLYRRPSGPEGWSGREGKISPPVGFKPQIIQLLARRYTKYDIPAAKYSNNPQNIMAPFDTVISNFTYMIFSPCTIWCKDFPFVSGIKRNIKKMAFKHITLW